MGACCSKASATQDTPRETDKTLQQQQQHHDDTTATAEGTSTVPAATDKDAQPQQQPQPPVASSSGGGGGGGGSQPPQPGPPSAAAAADGGGGVELTALPSSSAASSESSSLLSSSSSSSPGAGADAPGIVDPASIPAAVVPSIEQSSIPPSQPSAVDPGAEEGSAPGVPTQPSTPRKAEEGHHRIRALPDDPPQEKTAVLPPGPGTGEDVDEEGGGGGGREGLCFPTPLLDMEEEYDGSALDDLSDLSDLDDHHHHHLPHPHHQHNDHPMNGDGVGVDDEEERKQKDFIGGPSTDLANAQGGTPEKSFDSHRPRHQPSHTVMIRNAGEERAHHSLSSLSFFSEQSDDDLSYLEDADDPPTVTHMVNSGQFSCFALRMQEITNVHSQILSHGSNLLLPENIRLVKELAQVLQATKIRSKSAHRKGHLDDAGWAQVEEKIAETVTVLEESVKDDPKLLSVVRTNLVSGIRAGTLPAGRDLRRPALLPGILDDEPLKGGARGAALGTVEQ